MCVILLLLIVSPYIFAFDRNHWEKTSYEDFRESKKVKPNEGIAKNVILFIGTGMGPNTATAARIYKEHEDGYLSWERFDHLGALKTYSNDKIVPDSGSSATALFAGVKANTGTLGLSSDVLRNNCYESVSEKNRVVTIAKMAQEAGKATGIVTNGRVTQATTAAMYAHSADKDWECDKGMPYTAMQCKDIARQLIEDQPGKNFNVIMGGGRQQLMADPRSSPEDPIVGVRGTCRRDDNRNLIAEWERQKEIQAVNYTVPENKEELLGLDPYKTEYLLGIFQNDHFPFAYQTHDTAKGIPSLEEMATTAVKVLSNNKRGFFLLVESALIDVAHYSRNPGAAVSETIELSNAVQGTMKLLEAAGIKNDTLVIVTSSHSDTLTINGNPDLGSNILGTQNADNPSSKILNYATAGKVLLRENTNGGSDVFVYATGPSAYLFHRMHEQTYVPEVIQHALRIGRHSHHLHMLAKARRSGSSIIQSSIILLIATQLIFRLSKFM